MVDVEVPAGVPAERVRAAVDAWLRYGTAGDGLNDAFPADWEIETLCAPRAVQP